MGLETAAIIGIVGAALGTAGTVYAANQQKKSAREAISASQRRRRPFDSTARETSELLSELLYGVERGEGVDAARGFRPSETELAAQSRLRELLDNPMDIRGTLRDIPNQLVGDYLDQTRPAFGLDLDRLGSQIGSRFGGQFGVRAGSDLIEGIGRAGAEATTRRQAAAAGLLPAFGSLALQGTLASRAEPLSILQGALQSRIADQDLLRIASGFSSTQATPPSSALYMGGGPGGTAAGLASLGSLAMQYPLYSSLYSSPGVGYSAPGSAGTAGYTINTPVSEINLAQGFSGGGAR